MLTACIILGVAWYAFVAYGIRCVDGSQYGPLARVLTWAVSPILLPMLLVGILLTPPEEEDYISE